MFNIKLLDDKILEVSKIHESYDNKSNTYRLNLTLSGQSYSLDSIVDSINIDNISTIKIYSADNNVLLDTILNYNAIDHIFKSFNSENENESNEDVIISVGLKK